MRPTVSYIQNHGWHVGRLLWWPALLLLGQPVALAAGALDLGLRALTGVDAPFVLVAPLGMLLVAMARVQRRHEQGTIVVDRILRLRDMRVDTVRESVEPARFRRWLFIDTALWAGVAVGWSVLPVLLVLRNYQ